MRKLFTLAVVVIGATAASAQPLQPITLSPEEYRRIYGILAGRDPALSMLMAKQAEAMQAAAKSQDVPNPGTPVGPRRMERSRNGRGPFVPAPDVSPAPPIGPSVAPEVP